MTNEIVMKPCPFCGGTDIKSLEELDFVCCQNCGASLEDSEPSARVHWNTRAIPAQGEQVAADIDRLSSIWEDSRIRINVHTDYPELAAALDRIAVVKP